MAVSEYSRLTRTRSRRRELITLVATRSSLWIGKDHLLSVNSRRFIEEYKRFYFRDIQSIVIRTTNRRSVWNFILSLLVLLSMASVTAATESGPSRWAYGIWMTLLLVLLIGNNVLGTACTAYLQTAVQTEELPSL